MGTGSAPAALRAGAESRAVAGPPLPGELAAGTALGGDVDDDVPPPDGPAEEPGGEAETLDAPVASFSAGTLARRSPRVLLVTWSAPQERAKH